GEGYGNEAEIHPVAIAFASKLRLLLDDLPQQPMRVADPFVRRCQACHRRSCSTPNVATARRKICRRGRAKTRDIGLEQDSEALERSRESRRSSIRTELRLHAHAKIWGN